MYRRIMVPLDGSSFSEAAVPLALSVAEGRGAEIDLVTVPDSPPEEASDQRIAEAATTYLERVAQRIRERVTYVRTAVLRGAVAPALEQFARANGVDVTVMATHGRGAVSRFWLGSVADELVRHAPCPVLLVRPDAEPNGSVEPPPPFRSVLLPLDGSDVAEAVIEHALAAGRDDRARYTLLRVVRHPDELVSVYLPDTIEMTRDALDAETREAETYLARVADRLKNRGLDVTTEVVVEPRTALGILRYAHEHPIDLVAMATHGRGGVSRTVLGSTTDKVLRAVDVPILIYRPE